MKSRPCAVVLSRFDLEAVDDLQHEIDACLLGDVGGAGDRRDAVLAPAVARHRRIFGVRRIEDAAELVAADVAHRLDGVGEHLLAGLDDGRILARHVGVERQAHGDGDVEIKRLRLPRQAVEVEFLRAQIGELDQPVAAGGRFLHRPLDARLRSLRQSRRMSECRVCPRCPPWLAIYVDSCNKILHGA